MEDIVTYEFTYLNFLDMVYVNDQFLIWDPERQITVRIVSIIVHSLFMHIYVLCLKYPLYWSPFVRFQGKAYFFTKEDEAVAGSALADMIFNETNLYWCCLPICLYN